MIEQKVNVVSRDESFARLLELECNYMEIACTVSATPMEGASLYVIDCDHVSQSITRPHGGYILISETPSGIPSALSRHAISVLERPFLMSEFRNMILEFFVSSETKSRQNKSQKPAKLSFDAKKQSICVDGHTVFLTPAEYIILYELQSRAGKPLGKSEAALLLGGEKSSNLYEVHICSLRKKLASKTNRKYIYTLRGKGYYLKED